MNFIVNVGIGNKYPLGSKRLQDSLISTGYYNDGGRSCIFINELPPTSRPHVDCPYQFKVGAIDHAISQGATKVIWADSSVWFTQNPKPFFDYIDRRDCYITTTGFNVGQWTSDAALPKLGVTREEAFKMEMVYAIFWGFKVHSEAGKRIMEWMRERSVDGSFVGPWTNELHVASQDTRVLGHRHDQSALSVIWNRLGLPIERTPAMFQTGGDPKQQHIVAYGAGM